MNVNRGIPVRFGIYGNILLMRNLKLFTDTHTHHHLLKSPNGDMILYFKAGNVGLISGCVLCVHFTHVFSVFTLFCGYDRNSEGLSLSLNPTHIIFLNLLSPPVEKICLEGSFQPTLSDSLLNALCTHKVAFS